MTWQEMSDEILADVAQIMSASSTTEYVIGVMQWRGKIVAGPVYQPNILPVKVHDGENAASESINAKIQSVKYTARGFRNKKNFAAAILFHCGGLDLAP